MKDKKELVKVKTLPTRAELEAKSKPELVEKVIAMQRRFGNAILFGDPVFDAKAADGQRLQTLVAHMALDVKKKEVATIGQDNIVTVAGYDRMNQVASLNVVTPKEIVVDGQNVPNPYIEKHPQTRAIQSVTVKKIAWGYAPTGVLVATDVTLFFNIYTYFIQALQSKIKYCKQCGCLGKAGKPPEKFTIHESRWDSNRKRMIPTGEILTHAVPDVDMLQYFEIEGGAGVWVDLTHPEISHAFEEHTQRQRFADRIAQNICRRNALKSHPAISITVVAVDKDGKAPVTVYGFRHNLDDADIHRINKEVENGERPKEFDSVVEQEVFADDLEEVDAEIVSSGDDVITDNEPTEVYGEDAEMIDMNALRAAQKKYGNQDEAGNMLGITPDNLTQKKLPVLIAKMKELHETKTKGVKK